MKAFFAFIFLLVSMPAMADTVFDKILKTQEIRCGYYVFPPVTYKDSVTGELSGLSVDMMNAIAEQAGMKIKWTEEITFSNGPEGLNTGKFDVICTPMWPSIALGRVASFTKPFMFAPLSPMVRADDVRFKDDDLERLNAEDVIFAGQDADPITELAKDNFPKAQLKSYASMVPGPQILQDIVTGKADAIILDRNGEIEYNRHNDKKLRLVDKQNPLKYQSFTLAVKRDELILRDFLNNALDELINSGSFSHMLKKWEPEPNTFIETAKPYQSQ